MRLVEGLGHEVVPAAFPDEVAQLAVGEAWMPLWLMDIAMLIRDRARELGRGPGPDEIETMPRYATERIERMSGRCEITSQPGAGTRVSLSVPLEIPDKIET